MGNLEQWENSVQIVEFEPLNTGMREITDTSELQKRLYMNGVGEQQIPLLKSLEFYYGSYTYPCYSLKDNQIKLFKFLFSDLANNSRRDSDFSNYYIKNVCLKGNLIKIKKCIDDGKNYIFISDLWNIFSAEKKQFDSKWFWDHSLKLISKSPLCLRWLTDISDDDWKVKYFFKGTLVWTLQWSCFTYVKKSEDWDVAYIWNGSYIYKSKFIKQVDNISWKTTVSHKDDEAIDLGLWEIKKIALDPNQNLLFIISEDEDWKPNLHILDHKKVFCDWEPIIDEIKTIGWISDITFSDDGDIFLFKLDWTVDSLNTNLNSLKKNEWWSFEMKKIKVNKWKNQTKKDVLDSLWNLSISVDTTEVSNEWDKDNLKIIEWIRERPIEHNWVSKTLKEWFEDATTDKEIETVKKAFHQIIKQNEKLNSVPDLLGQIDKKIKDKKKEILLDSLFLELWDITKELEWSPDFITLVTIKEKLKTIKRKRAWIAVWHMDQDDELNNLSTILDKKIKDWQESHKDELIQMIDDNLLQIKELLDWYYNTIDVTKIISTPIRKETQEKVWLLDTATKKIYTTKMDDLMNNRLNEIIQIVKKEKEEESQEINNLKNDIKWKIEMLKLQFSTISVDDMDEIEDLWNSNEYVIRINEMLNPNKDNPSKIKIPQKDADDLLLLLRRTFDEIKYQLMISSVDSVWIVRSLDGFWIDTSLYYSESESEQVQWELSWKQLPNWKISLMAVVTNWETHKYDKSLYLESFTKWEDVKINWHTPKFDMEEEEFYKFHDIFNEYLKKWKKEMLNLSKQIKNETDEGKKKELRKTLRDKREYYKDARYVELLINRLIKQQKLNPRSKVPERNQNYIVLDEEKEIFKTLSARLRCQKKYGWIEILEWWPGLWKTVMCEFLASVTNREIAVVACGDIDPQTMICSPGMKDYNTVDVLSDWVKLMQKPWTLIVFDEIDKLPPAAIAKLHSLFDTRKSVYEGWPWEIKANPDCLFIGTRNLYDTLSNPIASRARIIRVTYPSAINEAYKISKYADKPILNVMKYEDFCALYDKYIIRQEPEPKNVKEKEVYQEIINIDKLLKVFNKLRELFSEDSYNYEISYRDAQQVYMDYNRWIDFKTATMNALLRWSWAVTEWDKGEKQEQINIVRDVIDSIM